MRNIVRLRYAGSHRGASGTSGFWRVSLLTRAMMPSEASHRLFFDSLDVSSLLCVPKT
jgi:hypothetical protein